MDTQISVLLLDDEPGIVELGRIYLEREGNMQIATATSVSEAISLLQVQDFDVVVSDYEMPGLTGIDLMRSLRERGRNTPIIIFTGKGNEEIAIEALNLGVLMYLRKGEDPKHQFSSLREKIREVAQSKWMEKLLKNNGKMMVRQLYRKEHAHEDHQYDNDHSTEALNKQGYQLATEGRNREALKVFDKVLEIDPGNLQAMINKGVCLGRLGMIDDEILQYKNALVIDPGNAIAWYNNGIACYQAGDMEQAKSSLLRTLKIQPDMAALLKEIDRQEKKSRTVLITGVGGASGQVLAKFFKNLPNYQVIGTDANANAPGQIFCHKFFKIPLASDPACIGAIRELCQSQKVMALFCTVDEELILVAEHKNDLPCHVLVSDPDSIAACLDKLVCMEKLSKAGIPCAKTLVPDGIGYDELVSVLGTPFIIKPRTGRGSRGVHLVRNRNEYDILFGASQSGQKVIAQEFLPGSEYTIDVLLDAKGTCAISVPRERLLTDSGVSIVGRTIQDEKLQELAKSASEAMRLCYIVNVQARRDPNGIPKIIEINPRPSGTLALTIASSAGMPEIAIDFSEGIDVANITPIIYIPGMTMFRTWEENFQQE